MIEVSYLRSVYHCPDRQKTVLHQSKITHRGRYGDFETFVPAFLAMATYPKATDDKFECYGWTPTFFAEHQNKRGVMGHWRHGDHADDHLTLFIADLDNQHPDRTMITMADVAEALTDLNLSHLLYSSFTSKAERPKFRIVIPVTRPLTPDEAFEVFVWFNTAFDRQLDAAIYDKGDHLYGPPMTSTIISNTDLDALDVDLFLALYRALPEADRTAVIRKANEKTPSYLPTDEEKARALKLRTDLTVDEAISIHNPRVFNPAWFELLDSRYIDESHSQSAFGLLKKAWMKSGGSLTFGDLVTLYGEIDDYHFGYLSRNYDRHERDRAIKSIMATFVAPRITQSPISASPWLRRVEAVRPTPETK